MYHQRKAVSVTFGCLEQVMWLVTFESMKVQERVGGQVERKVTHSLNSGDQSLFSVCISRV